MSSCIEVAGDEELIVEKNTFLTFKMVEISSVSWSARKNSCFCKYKKAIKKRFYQCRLYG